MKYLLKNEKIVTEYKECFRIFSSFIPKIWNRQAISPAIEGYLYISSIHCTVRWTVNVINWYRYCNVQLRRGASALFIIASYFFVYFSLHSQYWICIVQFNGIKWTHAHSAQSVSFELRSVENKIFMHRMEGVKITSRKIYYVQSWNILLSLAWCYFGIIIYLFFRIRNFHSIFIFQLRNVQLSAFYANSMLTWGLISCNTFFQMHCSDTISCHEKLWIGKKSGNLLSLFSWIAWIRARTKIFRLYYHVYYTHFRPFYHLMYTNALLTSMLMSAERLTITWKHQRCYMLYFRWYYSNASASTIWMSGIVVWLRLEKPSHNFYKIMRLSTIHKRGKQMLCCHEERLAD